MADEQSFLAWPSREILAHNCLYGLILFGLFCVLYGLSNYFTGLHNYRFEIETTLDRQMPFIESMSFLYLSISPFMLMAIFVFRTKSEFMRIFYILLIQILIACVIFTLFPVALPTIQPNPDGLFAGFWRFSDTINLDYNELPSLHVAFAISLYFFYSRKTQWIGKIIIFLWSALIVLSSLLTHHHFIIGALGGVLLSFLVLRFFQIYPNFFKPGEHSSVR